MSAKFLGQLRNRIDDTYSEDELKILCFDLKAKIRQGRKLDYENLSGTTRLDKIYSLLNELKKHKEGLQALFDKLIKERPDEPWMPHSDARQVVQCIIEQGRKTKLFKGMCLLIDTSESDTVLFNVSKISDIVTALATNTDLLETPYLIVKFFAPSSHLQKAINAGWPLAKFPYYPINWSEEKLKMLYWQRLIQCRLPNKQHDPSSPSLATLFSYDLRSEYPKVRSSTNIGKTSSSEDLHPLIDLAFIRLGMTFNSPQAMWRFGDLLITNHLNSRPGIDIPAEIQSDTFYKAFLATIFSQQYDDR